jgi:hypothetical protein
MSKSGWFRESKRHSLASRDMSTKNIQKTPVIRTQEKSIEKILDKHSKEIWNLAHEGYYGENEYSLIIYDDGSELFIGSYQSTPVNYDSSRNILGSLHVHPVEGGYEPSPNDIMTAYNIGGFFGIACPHYGGYKYKIYQPISESSYKELFDYEPRPKW